MTLLSAMRQHLLLLPAMLAALAFLSWAPAASAHAGHHEVTHGQPAQTATPGPVAAVHAAPQGTGHHCPARCHGCTAECQMQCAAAVALPTISDMQICGAQHRLEPAAIATRLGWCADPDQDPPRPSA